MDDRGITATVSTDTQKFARLDHRGLYIQNGALQITSTNGTTVVDGGGINAASIYTGSMNGIHMTIGTGNNVFKADANGIYLGSANFGAAPFRVDMLGNVTANNITLKGTINSSTMNNSDIVGGTLKIGSGTSVFKADVKGIYLGSETFIQAPFSVTPEGKLTALNASIRGDIVMTSGSIYWDSVGKPAYSAAEVGARPANWKPTPAEIGALVNSQTVVFNTLTNNGAARGLFMENGALYINAYYIKTGYISANMINAGYLSADRISGGTISSSTISVSSDVTIGNKLIINGSNYGAGISWGLGFEVFVDPSGRGMFLRTPSGRAVYANGIRLDQNQVAVFG